MSLATEILPAGALPDQINLAKLSPEQLEILETDLSKYVFEKAREDVNVFIGLHFRKPPHPMHVDFQHRVDLHKRVMIAAMRGSGKTFQITVFRNLWKLGNNPALRIKIICARQGKAKEYLGYIARHIKDCPQGICQQVFPDLKPDPGRSWTSEAINVIRPDEEVDTRDPSVEAWGITSSPEGSRADLMTFDDICTLDNTIHKPRERVAIKQAFVGTWMDLQADDNTEFVYVTTLWHPSDTSHALIKSPAWFHYIYFISDDFNRVKSSHDKSFPLPYPWGRGEMTKELLIEEYKTRGSFIFNRSYRNRPISQEDLLFREEMFFGDDNNQGAVSYGVAPSHKMFEDLPKYCGVDLAIGKEARNAKSVIFTAALSDGSNESIPKGKRIPIDIRIGQWSSPETARMILDVYNTYKPDVIRVENNTYQGALIEWLEDLEGISLPLEAHYTGHQKLKPDQGIPLLASEFERDLWMIPMKDRHPEGCPCNFCIWIKQMVDYNVATRGDDDTVLAAWFCQRAIKDSETTKIYYATWSS